LASIAVTPACNNKFNKEISTESYGFWRSKSTHPFEHALSLIRNPITFSGTPVKDYRAPPLLGADTRDVLATIGYDDAKLEALKAQKII